MSFGTRILIAVGCAATIAAAGCGGSPTAPSQAGATISGTVNGSGVLASSAAGRASANAPGTLTVTVSGTNITATVDASGRFVLSGVPAGDIQLVFSDGVNSVTVSLSNVNDQELIQILITINGSTVTIISEERTSGKVELCHATGNGSYHMIEVSVNAEPAHRAHGDGKVGDAVPADPTKVFNRQCRPVTPGVDIEKSTNGQDADSAPGPSIAVGSPVTWTYVVTNTGTANLSNVLVKDNDPLVVVTCPKTTLSVSESMTCTASGVAKAGQYRNVGTVTATSNLGSFTDSDASHYYGVTPTLDDDGPKVQLCHRTGNGSYHLIEVSVNAEPAHRGHGDGKIGEPVPGQPGKTFSPSCTVQ